MNPTQDIRPESGERLRFVLMAVLVVAFLIALPLMFVHPGLVLILFWSGLIIIAGAWLVHAIATRLGSR